MQQQQSNMVKPQKIGKPLKPMVIGKANGKKMGVKKAMKESAPTMKRVQASVKKTMGY